MTIFNFTSEEQKKLSAAFTINEIFQQPNTWLSTIKQIKLIKDDLYLFLNKILKETNYDIIFCGAGSSEFVGNALFSSLNLVCNNYCFKSYATTDLVASPEYYLSKNKKTLLVSFGRSGNSPESMGAIEIANKVCGDNIYHLVISCNKDGEIAKKAKLNDHYFAIDLDDRTHDKSFAMTSSFTNMYLAAVLSFNLDKLNELESIFTNIIRATERLLNDDFKKIEELINDYDFKRIVYLGSNSFKGIAQESALKMLELTKGSVVTMHDSPLGFRHGPKSIIDDNTLCIIYLSDDDYQYLYEYDLIKEIASQKKTNKLMIVGSYNRYLESGKELEKLADYTYYFDNKVKLNNLYLGIEYLTIAQLIALFKSLSLGISPDNPCPSGEVNRVVVGVNIYDYQKEEL